MTGAKMVALVVLAGVCAILMSHRVDALEVTRVCEGALCAGLDGVIVGRRLSTPFGDVDQFSLPLTDGRCVRWQPCALAPNPFSVRFTNASYMGPSQPQAPATYQAQIEASHLTLPGAPAFVEGNLQVTLLLPVRTAAESSVAFDTFAYTHGGGFDEGSSAVNDPAGQAAFARFNAVMLDYRIGIFGFMPMLVTGESRRPQNLGLLDSYLGEQWIAAYGSFFGLGGRLTHGGQSAGAGIVSLLPMLRNHFTGRLLPRLADGIVALSDYNSLGLRQATTIANGATSLTHVQLAQATGCLAASSTATVYIAPEVEACMLALSWQTLYATALGAFSLTTFEPVLDGLTLTGDVSDLVRTIRAQPLGPDSLDLLAMKPLDVLSNHGTNEGLLFEIFEDGFDFGNLAGVATYADFVMAAQQIFVFRSLDIQLQVRACYGDRPLGSPAFDARCLPALATDANWYVPLTRMAATFNIVANTVACNYLLGLLPNVRNYLTALTNPTTRSPFGSHSSDIDFWFNSLTPLETPAFSPSQQLFANSLGYFLAAFFRGNINGAVSVSATLAFPYEFALQTQVLQFDGSLQTVYVLGAASTQASYYPGGCDVVAATTAATFPCLQRISGSDFPLVAAVHADIWLATELLFAT